MPIHHIDILPTGTTTNPIQGSVIFNYYDIFPELTTDYLQVIVNGAPRNRTYDLVTGIYVTNIKVGDLVSITLFSEAVIYKNLRVVRRDYTTDDVDGNLGIVEVPISEVNINGQSAVIGFTAATASNSYNFEYFIFGSIGTNPTQDCRISGFSADFDGNFTIGDRGTSSTTKQIFWNNYGYFFDRNNVGVWTWPLSVTGNITALKDATLNYKADVINYVAQSDVPQYSLDCGLTFSASTISHNPSLINWSTMDCSNDGKYQAVAQQSGSFFVSSNSGTTYTAVTSSTKNWNVVRVPNNSGYPIYGSTSVNGDSIYKITSLTGYTTLSSTAKAPTGSSISDFAISRNSKYVFIAINNSESTNLMVSSNSGTTFTNVNTNSYMTRPKIAISSSGKYVYLAMARVSNTSTPNFIYSQDYGLTWQAAPSNAGTSDVVWSSINCSGTGKWIYVGGRTRGSDVGQVLASGNYLTPPYYSNFDSRFETTFAKPNKN